MDIKTTRFEANEIAKDTDFDYINDREYVNLCTIFEELFGRSVNDIIVGGLNCQQRATPSMNVDLSIGLGYCKSTGKIAHTGSLFGPIAITNGGAQTRIDLVEIRLKETDYDSQQRAFKDPVTGYISYQDINTKTRFEIEAQVIEGTEGSGNAANHTSGWVKIAEVTVDAGETTSILDADIENCTGGYDTETTTSWTAETAVTFRLGSIEDFKAKFRVKHKENGDHENDIIKDQHIDWGTGANQVSAIDVPVVDAGSLIDATEIETALQEIAKERVPVGVVIPWLPGYFNSTQSVFTAVSISLEDNYKECDGTVLNDAGSPIYNGAGRYLPKIDDSRFLMGTNTLSGDLRGGDNNSLAHTHGFTQPAAHGITQPTFTYSNHKHQIMHFVNITDYWYTYDSEGVDVRMNNPSLLGTDVSMKIAWREASTSDITLYSKTDGGGSCSIGTQVALSNNHSGGSVNAVTESRTDKNIPKYLACKYVQRIK